MSHLELGHYVASPLYLAVLVHCTLLGAMLGSTVGTCSASAPGFWTVFLVKVDSYPEVDSRPALLGLAVRRSLWLLELLHLDIWTLFPRRVFACVRHGGVAGSPGVSTPR